MTSRSVENGPPCWLCIGLFVHFRCQYSSPLLCFFLLLKTFIIAFNPASSELVPSLFSRDLFLQTILTTSTAKEFLAAAFSSISGHWRTKWPAVPHRQHVPPRIPVNSPSAVSIYNIWTVLEATSRPGLAISKCLIE